MKLEGKVAVITGGAGPVGRAVSKKLLSDGAKVVIAWFGEEQWKEARELIADYKGQYIDMQVDATNEKQVADLMKNTKEKFGGVDALIHTVGLFSAGTMLWETDTAVLQRLIDVNFTSGFICAKYAIKYMMEKQKGRLVFFPAKFAIDPPPGIGAFSVSSAALITLITALREELKDTEITANGIMPCVIDTWKTRKMPDYDPNKMTSTIDIADLVSYICSDESSALSGSILKVLGGF